MKLNDKLKQLRLNKGLSQEKLAKNLDMTRGTYIDYETGKRMPPVKILLRISKFFNVTITFLKDEKCDFPTQSSNDENIAIKETHGEHKKNMVVTLLTEDISGLLSKYDLTEKDNDIVTKAIKKAYLKTKDKK